MSVLFGGNLADELAESVRAIKEDFDQIDEDSFYQQKQWKRRRPGMDIMDYEEDEIPDHSSKPSVDSPPSNIEPDEQIQEEAVEKAVTDFIASADGEGIDPTESTDKQKSDDNEEPDNNTEEGNDSNETEKPEEEQHPFSTGKLGEVEYIDVRPQTIFRYSVKPKWWDYTDKKYNALRASFMHNQNSNVRTKYKNKFRWGFTKNWGKANPYKESKSPFLSQIKLRQHFSIIRRVGSVAEMKDSSRIGKLARKNQAFLMEVLKKHTEQGELCEMQKEGDVKFDRQRFERKMKYSMGIPRKRRQVNYTQFIYRQKMAEKIHADKGHAYWEAGLRVEKPLTIKTLAAKYGRRNIWSKNGIWRTKIKDKRAKSKKVGEWEYGKNISDWGIRNYKPQQ